MVYIKKRHLAQVVHYLDDLYRLCTQTFDHPNSLFKFFAIWRLQRSTHASTLIETGTFLGDTAARGARVFERVITIELDSALAGQASVALKRFSNVEVIEGDGTAVLPRVLAREEIHDVVIFLDGHYSGGVTAHGAVPEPSCHELEAIAPFLSKIRGVIIDDFRCFGTETGFPSKSLILSTAERVFGKGFDISVAYDQVIIQRSRGAAAR